MATMIVFIVLFLITGIFAVVQFVKNEDLVKEAKSAQEKMDELASSSEYNMVRPFAQKSGSRVQKTAMRQVIADMRYLGELILGEDMSGVELKGIRNRVEQSVDPGEPGEPGEEGALNRASAVLQTLLAFNEEDLPAEGEEPELTLEILYSQEGRFVGLNHLVDTLVDTIEALDGNLADLEGIYETETDSLRQDIAMLRKQLEDKQQQLDVASRAAQTYEDNYSARIDQQTSDYNRLLTERDDEIGKVQDEQKTIVAESDALKDEALGMQSEIKELREKLSGYQQDPDNFMEALQTDGYVLNVVNPDNLAYINLTRHDQIYRGLSFEVYDSYEDMPRSGQGKGSLEVIEVMEHFTKCRIARSDPTNPILENDTIANIIWDKDKTFQFCVAGDFDFDGDGRIDGNGRDQIITLIEGWGGQATSGLGVETNFLVLGRAPIMPPRPSIDEIDSGSPIALNYQKAEKLREEYKIVLETAFALGVPTFNRDRFMYFIGFYEQSKSPLAL
jgi:hypothetical protein